VKAAPLLRALRGSLRAVLVHTGQHYDSEMSRSFFEELRIPAPDHDLGIGSGSHGRMTGRMLEGLERVMIDVDPDLVLVVGDTNSTLAGALAAAKLGIEVAHVEAGLRSFDTRMPEEINRRLTDHSSTLLFCPTPTAVANLRREGLRRGVHRVGDVMMDAVLQNLARARRAGESGPDPEPRSYYLATLHRQELVEDPVRLERVVTALDRLPHPTLFPVHPRTRRRLRALGFRPQGSLRPMPPQPYLSMLRLQAGARVVLTDSGGVQKEAYILGTPCLTLRSSTEWVETLRGGANRLVGADSTRIETALQRIEAHPPRWNVGAVYGDGTAAKKITEIIVRYLGRA